MSVFKHQENKDSISKSITSLYGTEHSVQAESNQTQNLSPLEHRELIKSQIAGSFNSNTQTLSDEELEKSADNSLEKGGKRAVVGEKRTFGGREYIKTSGGWKFHGKGGGAKATAHREAALDHHVGEKTGSTARDKVINDYVTEYRKDANSDKTHQLRDQLNNIHQNDPNSKVFDKVGQAIIDAEASDKSSSKHIGDMSATQMKAAADKLGIDVKGKTTKQVKEALTSANIDKQIADFKAKKKNE